MPFLNVNGVLLDVDKGMRLDEALMRHGYLLDRPCAGEGRCGKCRVVASGELSAVSDEEARLLRDFAEKGLRLACMARIEGNCEVELPMRGAMGACVNGGPSAELRKESTGGCGVAIDIGTTTVACRLYGPKGELLSQEGFENPQVAWGSDVVSRIKAEIDGHGDAMRAALARAVDASIERMSGASGVEATEITKAVAVGNTVMLCLFAGISVEPLSHAPFEIGRPFGRVLSREEVPLKSLPRADVYVPRCPASFVGGDVVAAALACGMFESEGHCSMMVDVGTNGEIVLASDGLIACSSTAAGPAFEGAGLSCGMIAAPGAIDRVTVGEDGALGVHVMGDVRAEGICGSGAIEALACLLELGRVDGSGFLEGSRAVLADGVYISQEDVRRIQLAKAAVCAGMLALIEHVGKKADEIERIWIAGGFGSRLDFSAAEAIGMLPPGVSARCKAVGNAALDGAALLLADATLREDCDRAVMSMLHKDLAADAVFVRRYTEGMLFGCDASGADWQ